MSSFLFFLFLVFFSKTSWESEESVHCNCIYLPSLSEFFKVFHPEMRECQTVFLAFPRFYCLSKHFLRLSERRETISGETVKPPQKKSPHWSGLRLRQQTGWVLFGTVSFDIIAVGSTRPGLICAVGWVRIRHRGRTVSEADIRFRFRRNTRWCDSQKEQAIHIAYDS